MNTSLATREIRRCRELHNGNEQHGGSALHGWILLCVEVADRQVEGPSFVRKDLVAFNSCGVTDVGGEV